MKKIFLYLDTDVWVNYLIYTRNKKERFAHKKTLPIDKINGEKVDIFISEINLIEISEKLSDEKRMKKCFDDCLSILEIRKTELQKHTITKEELQDINDQIKSQIINLPLLVSDKTPDLSSKSLRVLTEICSTYSIFFIDALHFLIAGKMKCDYFISGDTDLVNKLNKLIKDLSIKTISVYNVKEFKNNKLKKFI